MYSSGKKVFFADHVFCVNKNVYEPAEDSFLFAENLAVREGDKVVDVGTGCGILGIVAAVKAAEVLAVDVNPWAIRCAKENARLNHVAHKMFFMQGDLFAPIRARERFDLILFNAPYVPSEEVEGSFWVERAWAGGISGRKTIDNFIREAPKHLRSNGEILLLQSTLAGVEETSRGFEERGFRVDFVARQDLPFFETIILVKARFGNKNNVGF
jgi:release factor glutamine methyltransferase